MPKKLAIPLILFVITLVISISLVEAQISESNLIAVLYEDAESNLIALSNNRLTFTGDEATTQLNRTIIVVGFEENVQVDFFPAKLYDNSSANEISIEPIAPFSVSMNQQVPVDVIINTSGATAETYYGSIIVTARTSENSTSTNIDVVVTITGEAQPLTDQLVIMSIVLLMLFVAVALALVDKATLAVIFLSLGALLIWFSSIIAAVFVADLTTAFGTAIIVPWAGFVIDHVKHKRDGKAARIKTSTEVLSKAIKEDIDWLRGIVGETTTHFASFNPKFEGIKESPKTPEIFYRESGVLSKKKWEDKREQGAVSDLPILHLEKYYDYIELYNRYYKAAIITTKGKTANEFETLLEKDPFLVQFELFRNKYAELETVLFVYMSYFIGLFGQTHLSPLRVEYPRVNRVLLYKLLEYEILEPRAYVFKRKRRVLWHDFENTESKEYFETQLECRFSFEEKYKDAIANKEKELNGKYPNDKGRRDREFKKWFEEEFEKSEAEIKREINEKKVVPEEWKEKNKKWAMGKLFKKKIEDWELSPKDLGEILKDMYQKDDIPRFYDEVGQDFRYTFLELLECIKELEPLPEEYLAKEKIPDILKQHEIHKRLLDELEKLNKLVTEKAITIPEFEATKKEILEKFKSDEHKPPEPPPPPPCNS